MEADNAYENRTNKITRKKASHREGLAIAIIKNESESENTSIPPTPGGDFLLQQRLDKLCPDKHLFRWIFSCIDFRTCVEESEEFEEFIIKRMLSSIFR